MNYLVWWLRQIDYEQTLYKLMARGQRPDEIPTPVWNDVFSRDGRSGRCRIWNSYLEEFNGLPIHHTDIKVWDDFKILLGEGPMNDAGSIIIPPKSGVYCKQLCGIVTTPNLIPI